MPRRLSELLILEKQTPELVIGLTLMHVWVLIIIGDAAFAWADQHRMHAKRRLNHQKVC